MDSASAAHRLLRPLQPNWREGLKRQTNLRSPRADAQEFPATPCRWSPFVGLKRCGTCTRFFTTSKLDTSSEVKSCVQAGFKESRFAATSSRSCSCIQDRLKQQNPSH